MLVTEHGIHIIKYTPFFRFVFFPSFLSIHVIFKHLPLKR